MRAVVVSTDRVQVAPSILAADFSRLGDQIQAVKRGGAKIIHCDVMDGHFVPNITLGVPVVASLRKATDLVLDTHLMIEHPDQYVSAFARAGADMISVHQEATPHLDRVLNLIKEGGARAGVVINPATPVSTLEEVLSFVDHVLVMSVNPGYGGQNFIPRACEKIRQLRELRERNAWQYRIEVDGGVGPKNAGELVRAGAEILVAGTSIFHTADAEQAFRRLQQLSCDALVQRV